MQHVKSLYARN